jgi:hypothetical protein
MTLPASGAITLAAIRNEFKAASGAVSLSEMYRSGTYVPPLTANAAIPTSGAIQMDDFYSATVSTDMDATYDASWISLSNGATGVTLEVHPDGAILSSGYGDGGSVTGFSDTWVVASANPGAWYELYVSVSSGNTPTGDSLNTWIAITSIRYYSLDIASGPDSKSCTLSVKIRHKYNTASEETTTVTLSCSSSK